MLGFGEGAEFGEVGGGVEEGGGAESEAGAEGVEASLEVLEGGLSREAGFVGAFGVMEERVDGVPGAIEVGEGERDPGGFAGAEVAALEFKGLALGLEGFEGEEEGAEGVGVVGAEVVDVGGGLGEACAEGVEACGEGVEVEGGLEEGLPGGGGAEGGELCAEGVEVGGLLEEGVLFLLKEAEGVESLSVFAVELDRGGGWAVAGHGPGESVEVDAAGEGFGDASSEVVVIVFEEIPEVPGVTAPLEGVWGFGRGMVEAVAACGEGVAAGEKSPGDAVEEEVGLEEGGFFVGGVGPEEALEGACGGGFSGAVGAVDEVEARGKVFEEEGGVGVDAGEVGDAEGGDAGGVHGASSRRRVARRERRRGVGSSGEVGGGRSLNSRCARTRWRASWRRRRRSGGGERRASARRRGTGPA